MMELYSFLYGCLELFFGAVAVCWSMPLLRFFMAAMLLSGAVGLVLLLKNEVQH